ncbi:hypothetical protein AB0M54_13120 [Actinoplanes sp. NPDC051470]|uniref:phthiocerol/phthiodiolone dimycocerosyl transferase family protein n=1 Tax=Actinoplanes sp. NPDC051470 TaxID=3157224 RepID=UPI003448EFBC
MTPPDRPLGMMEQALRALARRAQPLHFALAAVVSGAPGEAGWGAALAQVQRRHPLLRAAVVPGPDGPCFAGRPGTPIPLQVTEAADWTDSLVTEMTEPFPAGPAPLLRARLLPGPRRTTIILTGHTAIDGLSLAVVLRDLLRTLAGRDLSGGTRALPMEHYLLNGARVEVGPHPYPVGAPPQMIDAALPPRVDRIAFGRELTELVCDRAHQEGVTVHTVLAAALAAAMHRLGPGADGRDLRFGSQVNLRRTLPEIGDSVGFYSIPVVRPSPRRDGGLWASARRFKDDLDIFRQPGRIAEAMARLGEIRRALPDGEDPAGWARAISQTLSYDILLTNLGALPIPLRYGPLRLEELWGPAGLVGFADEHVVGASTVGGDLTMLYTSRDPVPGLLSTAREIIGKGM